MIIKKSPVRQHRGQKGYAVYEYPLATKVYHMTAFISIPKINKGGLFLWLLQRNSPADSGVH